MTDLLAGLRSGAWLDAQVFPPVRYVVPGIIPEGSTLFAGPPKAGKSWFMLGMSLATSSGGRFLGLEIEARPTLYLALEDGHRRIQERARKLLVERPIPTGFEYLITTEPGQVVATIEAWLDRHPGDAPVVVLDTLGKVVPPAMPGESAYGRDYRVGSGLKRLVDAHEGAALVVVHHDRKAQADDFVDAVSGSNGLAGAADTVVVLARPRHEDLGTLQVTGRDVREGEYAIRIDGGCRWELEGGDLRSAAAAAVSVRASAGLGDRSAEVVALAVDHPGGIRAAHVADALGIDAKHAGTYLARLADAGRLERLARGLYGRVESVGSVGTGEPPRLGFNTSHTLHTSSNGREVDQ